MKPDILCNFKSRLNLKLLYVIKLKFSKFAIYLNLIGIYIFYIAMEILKIFFLNVLRVVTKVDIRHTI